MHCKVFQNKNKKVYLRIEKGTKIYTAPDISMAMNHLLTTVVYFLQALDRKLAISI